METVGIACQSIACLFAILEVAILFFVNKEHTHNKVILAVLLIVLLILNLNGVLFHTGWYLKHPAFHKIAVPFSLLVSPIAFLYIRSVLAGDLKFRKMDWLLLLPAFLFALNYLPYYLMPVAEKKVYLVEYYKSSKLRSSDSEGFLPAYFFAFFRGIWSLIFILLNLKIIKAFKKNIPEKVLTDNSDLLRWVSRLNKILGALLLAALFAAFIAPIKQTIFNILDIALGGFVLIICIKLFTRPKILYGIYQPVETALVQVDHQIGDAQILAGTIPVENEAQNGTTQEAFNINQAETLRYKKLLEDFFVEAQPFLNPDYSLEQLVIDLGIPRYLLSAFVNREYNMGFREFLNRYRVAYFKANLNDRDWRNLTLEGIAEQCGFSSRTTFIKNFKEITGQTPSEYVKSSQRKS